MAEMSRLILQGLDESATQFDAASLFLAGPGCRSGPNCTFPIAPLVLLR